MPDPRRRARLVIAATAALWVAWFLLPAITLHLGVLGTRSYTFWTLLGIDPADPGAVRHAHHGVFTLVGLLALTAPLLATDRRTGSTGWLAAAPLVFLLLTLVRLAWEMRHIIQRGLRPDHSTLGRLTSKLTHAAARPITHAIALRAGLYLVLVLTLLLAALAAIDRARRVPPSAA